MQTVARHPAPNRMVPQVKAIIGWIVETDRKFRVAQNRIDRIADRF